MFKREHAEILLQGVPSWNDWRRQSDGRPNLVRFNLTEFTSNHDASPNTDSPTLKDIDFSKTDLRHSVFVGADLSRANFQGADLSGANFSRANLSGADLTSAEVIATNFSCAKLRSARLDHADATGATFTDADLNHASLKGADLSSANLERADLTETNLWSAILVPRRWYEWLDDDFELNQSTIEHVQDLLRLLKHLQQRWVHSPFDDPMTPYFRGHSSISRQLTPRAMHGNLRDFENEMLTALLTSYPDHFNNTEGWFDKLAIAQHFGLPTRLLDVTRNPLVGLYFAAQEISVADAADNVDENGCLHVFGVHRHQMRSFDSDTISVLANFTRLSRQDQIWLMTNSGVGVSDGSRDDYEDFRYGYRDILTKLQHFVAREKPYFQNRIDPRDLFRVYLVEPKIAFDRIRSQSGAFLISAFHESFEPEAIFNASAGYRVYDHYSLIIPQKKKHQIRTELRRLNITKETLFPGLASASEAIFDNYKQNNECISSDQPADSHPT